MIEREAQIITECQNGQMQGFALLYDAYVKKIYNFIYYKTLHQETTEDLVSLTFTKALEKIKAFKPEVGTFSAWLYQIARNNVIDHYRNLKNDANLEDFYDLADDIDIKIDSENRLLLEEVKKYLSGLKQEQREIITLKLWDGLSHQEIAQIMGISEANSKMIFSRSMTKLRSDLRLSLASLIFIISKLYEIN